MPIRDLMQEIRDIEMKNTAQMKALENIKNVDIPIEFEDIEMKDCEQ